MALVDGLLIAIATLLVLILLAILFLLREIRLTQAFVTQNQHDLQSYLADTFGESGANGSTEELLRTISEDTGRLRGIIEKAPWLESPFGEESR